MSQPLGHSAAGRIMSVNNSNYTIRNRTRDHPACSAVPQPTAPSRASKETLALHDKNQGDSPRTVQPSAKDDQKSVGYQTQSDGGRHRSALGLPWPVSYVRPPSQKFLGCATSPTVLGAPISSLWQYEHMAWSNDHEDQAWNAILSAETQYSRQRFAGICNCHIA
jgi:hypothetical protein